MTMRSTTSDAARRSQTGISRATIREMDDDHLCQEVKQADVMHSETPTNFEMWHPLGVTSVALKQKEEKQQQQQQQGQQGGGQYDWNKNQPKGPAAEAMMLYVNGTREHPVAMVNDRRVRPYGMKPGEGAMYSPEGSGQMVYHRVRGDDADGLYMLTCDDQSGELHEFYTSPRADSQPQKRFVSIRHVEKKKQGRTKSQQSGAQMLEELLQRSPREGEQGNTGRLPDDSKSKYKHEGEINTEQQFTAQRIQYNEGGGDIGYYDRSQDWMHHMPGDKKLSSRCDKDHTHIMSDKGNVLWVSKKENGVFASKPIIIKPDECNV